MQNSNKFNTNWKEIIADKDFEKYFLSGVLEDYIVQKRWYAGKANKIKHIELSDHFKIEKGDKVFYGLVLEIDFVKDFYHHYFLPIAFVTDDQYMDDYILSVEINKKKGFIIDAIHLEEFRKLIFESILTAKPNDKSRVRYHKNESIDHTVYTSSRFLGVEQSNTSIVYNEEFVLKFFRRIFANKNPDYEISRFLTEKKEFENTPAYQGSLNVIDSEKEIVSIALMQKMVPNQGDAWEYMLKELDKVFTAIASKKIEIQSLPKTELYSRLKIEAIPNDIINWVGLDLFQKLQTIAKRTAEMHIVLGSEFEETAFTPTHFNSDYTVWLKNRLLYQFQNRLHTVENNLQKLEGLSLELASQFLENKNSIRKRFVNFDWTKLKGERIRVHGDYHLGQILVKDDDFYILDFEGEPESTIRDRKVKQPPLKDVAGMFRSFHYAIYATIFNNGEKYIHSQETLFKFAEILYSYFTGVFLAAYTEAILKANLNIGYEQERNFILKYCLLEKAVYELGYELNSRPRWALIPLKGISNIIKY